MERQEVEQLLTKIKPGSKLKLTYKKDKDSARATLYLIGMVNVGIIKFENGVEEGNVWATGTFGYWGEHDNRVIKIITTEKFDSQGFIDRTYWPLEKLEIVA